MTDSLHEYVFSLIVGLNKYDIARDNQFRARRGWPSGWLSDNVASRRM